MIWALVTIGRIVKNKFNNTILKNAVNVIANESTNIWFLHCIFFTPNSSVQYIAYAPHYGILIIIWVLIMLIPISMVLRKITNPIIKKINEM